MSSTETPKPVVLCILDGFGHREDAKDNAVAQANTPNIDAIMETYPHSMLSTSGLDVGLPEGQMGNSEVGHTTIGSGRVMLQHLPRITRSIHTNELHTLPEIIKLIEQCHASGGICHVMGLLSDGGVHSHMDHVIALSNILAEAGIKVWVHAFTDGRDTPPKSALEYVRHTEAALHQNANIATISGRYYAMDRDTRWERVQLAYDAIVSGEGEKASSAMAAVKQSYDAETLDEFVLPTVIGDYAGVQHGDAFVMANFRSDRVRQLLAALVEPSFDGFERSVVPRFTACVGTAEYSDALDAYMTTLFPTETPVDSLGEVVARNDLKQLRIAETEKYAHVTFFFNGGVEDVFQGEDRILIPSPQVATYDLQPEMSAPEVTEKLLEVIGDETYDLIVVNYANTDMVGHTGDLEAAVKAVETIDTAVGKLRDAVLAKDGVLCISADHGNSELMRDQETQAPHTAHTTFPVPFIVIAGPGRLESMELRNGLLSDIAPTILSFMNIDVPDAMTGANLVT